MLTVLTVNNGVVIVPSIIVVTLVVWRIWHDIDRSLLLILIVETVGPAIGLVATLVIVTIGNARYGGTLPAEIDSTFLGLTIINVILFLCDGTSLSLLIWSVWRMRPVRRDSARHASQRAHLQLIVSTTYIGDTLDEFHSCNEASESSESVSVVDPTTSSMAQATSMAHSATSSSSATISARRIKDLTAFEELLNDRAHRERFTQLLWTQFHSSAFSFCETMQLVRLLTRENHPEDARKYLKLAVDLYVKPKAGFPVSLPMELCDKLISMCDGSNPTDMNYKVINTAYLIVLDSLLDVYFGLMGTSMSEDESTNVY